MAGHVTHPGHYYAVVWTSMELPKNVRSLQSVVSSDFDQFIFIRISGATETPPTRAVS